MGCLVGGESGVKRLLLGCWWEAGGEERQVSRGMEGGLRHVGYVYIQRPGLGSGWICHACLLMEVTCRTVW